MKALSGLLKSGRNLLIKQTSNFWNFCWTCKAMIYCISVGTGPQALKAVFVSYKYRFYARHQVAADFSFHTLSLLTQSILYDFLKPKSTQSQKSGVCSNIGTPPCCVISPITSTWIWYWLRSTHSCDLASTFHIWNQFFLEISICWPIPAQRLHPFFFCSRCNDLEKRCHTSGKRKCFLLFGNRRFYHNNCIFRLFMHQKMESDRTAMHNCDVFFPCQMSWWLCSSASLLCTICGIPLMNWFNFGCS